LESNKNYMLAHQFIAKDMAGLTLAGRDFEGDYQWIGDKTQWTDAEVFEEAFELTGSFEPAISKLLRERHDRMNPISYE
jgi:hypothetical protein